MTIIEERPITMAQVANLAGDSEKGLAIKNFIKQFSTLPIKKANELQEELRGLDILKLKEAHIVKIVDFLPSDASDLTKIVNDVSLDQEETTKVLDVVKKY